MLELQLFQTQKNSDKECISQNINIFPIPGPSAVTASVSVSGFSEKYFFYGFFPEKTKEIEKTF